MQEILSFRISGISGILRKPESNIAYFTYSNIHKMALLGILGAIIGENGYNYNSLFKDKKDLLPEYYIKLKDLKVGIEPLANKGVFSTNKVTFNNSVGYASKEEGNVLVVNEEWLENPAWNIYILDNKTEEYEKIKMYLKNQMCEYIPYIGKNEHFATITDVQIVQATISNNETKSIHSIFFSNDYEVLSENSLDIFAFDNKEETFVVKEVLPTKLDNQVGYSDFKEFVYTNAKVRMKESVDIYDVLGKNIFFF